jgi:hypothetical protein
MAAGPRLTRITRDFDGCFRELVSGILPQQSIACESRHDAGAMQGS